MRFLLILRIVKHYTKMMTLILKEILNVLKKIYAKLSSNKYKLNSHLAISPAIESRSR